MSNLENLTSKIVEDGNNKAQSILDAAVKEESRILGKGREEAERRCREILDKANMEAKLKKGRIISNAELEVRNQKLSAKQEVIGRVFVKALENLRNMSEDQYLAFVRNTILSSPIRGDEVVVVNSQDKINLTESFINELNTELAQQGKKGELTLKVESRNINGGFLLIGRGIEINYTFEAVVASLREELEGEVAKILFG